MAKTLRQVSAKVQSPFILLLFASAVFAQGVRYDVPPILNSRAVLVPNANISLCPGTATITNSTCSPTSTQAFTDITLTTPCATGSPVVLPQTNTCQGTADSLGNAGFWLSPGNYIYCINGPSITGKCYNLTAPIGSTASTLSKIQYVNLTTPGNDWCAKVQTADTALGATHGEIWIDATSVINACATTPTIQPGHTLRFLQGGTYVLSSTLTLSGNGSKLVGVGGGPGEASTAISGVTLQATAGFATATPVVKFHDITKGGLQWVNVDCNAVTNCIAIQYDSDNSPPSSQNTFEHFALTGCHHCFVMGVDSLTALQTPASCLANANQLGCYQMDTDRVENFQIYGNCTVDTTPIGILINSANGFQNGRITRGDLQCVNMAVRIVFYNGEGQLDNFNCGSPRGTAPECVHLDTNAAAPTIMINLESEGTGWAHGLHDSSCNPLQTAPASPWIANAWFGSGAATTGILVDGCAFVLSGANTGQATTFQAAGTSHILSLTDTLAWCSTPGTITAPGCSLAGSGIIDYWWNGFIVTSGDVGIGGKEKVAKSLVVGSQTFDSGIIGVSLASNAMFTAPGTTDIVIDSNQTLPSAATSEFDGYFSGLTGAASTIHNVINDIKIGGAAVGGGGTINTQNMILCGAPGGAGTTNCLNNSGAGNIILGTGAVKITNTVISGTVPTIAAAGCGGAAASIVVANGTAAFKVNVGTTPTSACTLTFPAATTGWNVTCNDITTQSANVFVQKQTGAESTTSATITNFSTAAAATAFVASDILKCTAFAD